MGWGKGELLTSLTFSLVGSFHLFLFGVPFPQVCLLRAGALDHPGPTASMSPGRPAHPESASAALEALGDPTRSLGSERGACLPQPSLLPVCASHGSPRQPHLLHR